jgi:hypothetical protein
VSHPIDSETSPDPASASEPAPKPASTFSESFKQVVARQATSASSGDAPKTIRRRRATFTIDHELCEPGVFGEDFKVTVEGLSAAQELDALKSGSDGASMGFAMAKLSIREFNGRPLQGHEREMLWEWLGFAGRTAVTSEYMKHCTGVGDGASLGKSLGVELS